MKKGIIWFRNNLRLADNECITRALDECDEVLCVYIIGARDLESFGRNSQNGFEPGAIYSRIPPRTRGRNQGNSVDLLNLLRAGQWMRSPE